MNQKMTWEEILEKYPEQWVALTAIEKDSSGAVQSAIVTAYAPDIKVLTQQLKHTRQPSDRFEYTGSIKNFLGFSRWTIEGAADEVPTSK